MNYKLTISYDGTNYSGWQIQPDSKTIQEIIEKSLMKIFSDQNIKVIGSGRTDAGVHANGQVANVNIENSKMNESQIKNAINSYLPNDIFINDCTLVKDEFHARFTAKKREYFYYISNNYHPKNRFYVWNCKWELDLNILNKCSEMLIGEHDFSSFSKASSDTKNKICKLYESYWIMDDSKLIYKVKANRFLQHMVRLLVGSMVEVSRGRISIKEFERILKNKKSKFTAVRAPATGLFLNEIFYE